MFALFVTVFLKLKVLWELSPKRFHFSSDVCAKLMIKPRKHLEFFEKLLRETYVGNTEFLFESSPDFDVTTVTLMLWFYGERSSNYRPILMLEVWRCRCCTILSAFHCATIIQSPLLVKAYTLQKQQCVSPDYNSFTSLRCLSVFIISCFQSYIVITIYTL